MAPRARCVRVGERWPLPSSSRAATRGAGRAASAHDVPPPPPRMPSSGRRSAAKRLRSTLCAVPAGAAAPGITTTEEDPPRARRPRRTATCEAASVGAATSGGASLASACSTGCAPPSAATNASSASPSEPLDALSLAQREASVVPHTPARPPSAPPPRTRLAPLRKSHLPRFGIGGGETADAYPLSAAVCAAPGHGTALARGPRVLGPWQVALPQLRRRLERGRRADAPPPPRLPAPAERG